MPQPIFNVVPKDPQIQHVTANMRNPGMHKHACEDVENIPRPTQLVKSDGIISVKSVLRACRADLRLPVVLLAFGRIQTR
jgi:hypothetical protein